MFSAVCVDDDDDKNDPEYNFLEDEEFSREIEEELCKGKHTEIPSKRLV